MADVVASVIIPTFEDWEKLAACLACLENQTIESEIFEIVVANNNPSEDLPQDVKLPLNARVVWQEKPGSYAARNLAIKAARGRYLFFTDSDCRPAPNWLVRGIDIFESEPELSRIAGRIDTVPASGRWNSWAVHDAIFRLRQEAYARRGVSVTANLAARSELFQLVGMFSEERYSGGDIEWNRRAALAGYSIKFDNEMVVAHDARDSFAESAMKVRRMAGARYAAKAGRPVAQKMPRLSYLLPSPKSALAIYRQRRNFPLGPLIASMGCDYVLGWVHNYEIIRLWLAGHSPARK